MFHHHKVAKSFSHSPSEALNLDSALSYDMSQKAATVSSLPYHLKKHFHKKLFLKSAL